MNVAVLCILILCLKSFIFLQPDVCVDLFLLW